MKTILNRLFKHKVVVNCERQPYLTRWYLFRRQRFAFFLHWFHRSDEDRALHDHPWSFVTFILWRGYIEHTESSQTCWLCDGTGLDICECKGAGIKITKLQKRKWPGMICFRPAEWKHRVELVGGKPAWTIVLRFKERREWGFWTPSGWQQWNKWWQNNCE